MDERKAHPEFFDGLKRRLGQPLPGLAAQLEMVPDPRPGNKVYTEVQDSCTRAGVMALLYPGRAQIFLVLTRRTDLVDHHQAQISFPGGRQEEGESLEKTALRETEEELGIPMDSARQLGRLTPLYIPPTNYCIYPYVACLDRKPEFIPSAFEVAEVLEIPLAFLADPKSVGRELWTLHGKKISVPFFLFEGHKIWGATAMVLAEFVSLLRELEV